MKALELGHMALYWESQEQVQIDNTVFNMGINFVGRP